MKTLVSVLALSMLAGCANAGRLPSVSFTSPAFEASAVGDTCAAGSVPETSLLTVRMRAVGPATVTDSLVGVSPNTPVSFAARDVPRGSYTITVDSRDSAGNWSCPASIVREVKGKPARGVIGWLDLAREQRERLARM